MSDSKIDILASVSFDNPAAVRGSVFVIFLRAKRLFSGSKDNCIWIPFLLLFQTKDEKIFLSGVVKIKSSPSSILPLQSIQVYYYRMPYLQYPESHPRLLVLM